MYTDCRKWIRKNGCRAANWLAMLTACTHGRGGRGRRDIERAPQATWSRMWRWRSSGGNESPALPSTSLRIRSELHRAPNHAYCFKKYDTSLCFARLWSTIDTGTKVDHLTTDAWLLLFSWLHSWLLFEEEKARNTALDQAEGMQPTLGSEKGIRSKSKFEQFQKILLLETNLFSKMFSSN